MNSLEYRRLPNRPSREAAIEQHAGVDWLKLVKRIAWLASSIFLIHHWQLHHIPHNYYAYLALLALAAFAIAFSYIVISIRRQYGYSDSAPPHGRWKHYSPRAVEVMSLASFLFYCFAAVAYYGSLGLVVFPGMAVVCYGFSGMLSYL